MIAVSVWSCRAGEEPPPVPGSGPSTPASPDPSAGASPVEPSRPEAGRAIPNAIQATPTTAPDADADSARAPSADERLRAILDADPEGAGLDMLIRAASVDEDPSAREAAIIALGDSDDPRALDALIAATDDREPGVVIAAIEQLRWFDDRLAENAIRRRIDAPDPEVARAAREALADSE